MLKNKKSIELSLTVVVVTVILLMTAFILIAIFQDLIGKERKQANQIIGDYDGDGILDMADKCPCKAGVQEYEGCPSESMLQQYKEAEDKSTFRACLITKKET